MVGDPLRADRAGPAGPVKYRTRCIGRPSLGELGCGWSGVRTDSIECECYDIWSLYCHPFTPGPGCPRGLDWPCPRCGGAVTGKPVQPRGPVKGLCEMSKGWEVRGNPQAILCRQPGVERRDMPAVVGHPIACDDCYTAWLNRAETPRRIPLGEPVERGNQHSQDPAQ